MANPEQPEKPNEYETETGQGDGQSEIDPGRVGNNTEVDLDRTHIEKYPNPGNDPQRK